MPLRSNLHNFQESYRDQIIDKRKNKNKTNTQIISTVHFTIKAW